MILKLNKRQAYFCLLGSILFEQIGTTCLTASEGFTKIGPVIGLIVSYAITIWLFSQLLQHISLSISYATWTAAGTVTAALIGFLLFDQEVSAVGWLGILIMCIGIFILNLFGTPRDEKDR